MLCVFSHLGTQIISVTFLIMLPGTLSEQFVKLKGIESITTQCLNTKMTKDEEHWTVLSKIPIERAIWRQEREFTEEDSESIVTIVKVNLKCYTKS